MKVNIPVEKLERDELREAFYLICQEIKFRSKEGRYVHGLEKHVPYGFDLELNPVTKKESTPCL